MQKHFFFFFLCVIGITAGNWKSKRISMMGPWNSVGFSFKKRGVPVERAKMEFLNTTVLACGITDAARTLD